MLGMIGMPNMRTMRGNLTLWTLDAQVLKQEKEGQITQPPNSHLSHFEIYTFVIHTAPQIDFFGQVYINFVSISIFSHKVFCLMLGEYNQLIFRNLPFLSFSFLFWNFTFRPDLVFHLFSYFNKIFYLALIRFCYFFS